MKHTQRSGCMGWVGPDAIFELEAMLATPKFSGCSIGSLLGDYYISSLLHGQARWDLRSATFDCLRCIYHMVRQPRGVGLNQSIGKGKFLITSIAARPSLSGLILPVIDELGSSSCVVIGHKDIKQLLPRITEFIDWRELGEIEMSSWRREYLRDFGAWLRAVNSFARRHCLTFRIVPDVMNRIAVQTQRLLQFSELVRVLQPSLVLTEFDRQSLVSPLIAAARSTGTPTITLVHGTANRFLTPVLADLVCCWGEADRRTFLDCGVDSGRIFVTGSPFLSRSALTVSTSRRVDILKRDHGKVVLFASSPIAMHARREILSQFCRALTDLEDITAVVRLHPSERCADVQDISSHYPEVHFLSANDCTLGEILSLATLVVVHASCVGQDALFASKPIIVLDSVGGKWPNIEEFRRHPWCPIASNCTELATLVRQLSSDERARAAQIKAAEQYVQSLCSSFGAEAGRRIASVLRKLSAGAVDIHAASRPNSGIANSTDQWVDS